MPMVEERMTGVTLKALPLLIHYINKIGFYSSFFKLMQAKEKELWRYRLGHAHR